MSQYHTSDILSSVKLSFLTLSLVYNSQDTQPRRTYGVYSDSGTFSQQPTQSRTRSDCNWAQSHNTTFQDKPTHWLLNLPLLQSLSAKIKT